MFINNKDLINLYYILYTKYVLIYKNKLLVLVVTIVHYPQFLKIMYLELITEVYVRHIYAFNIQYTVFFFFNKLFCQQKVSLYGNSKFTN